jgi:hypothetical protein
MFVSSVFVLSDRGLCDGPIPRPEESYRLWCVLECDQTQSQKPSTPAVNKWVEEGRTTKVFKCLLIVESSRYYCIIVLQCLSSKTISCCRP